MATENEWAALWMDTSLQALCLKERGKGLLERKFGRLNTPSINIGDVHTHREFESAVRKHTGEVVVIGHEDDKLVWRGTTEDFLEMWEVD